jgi:hypothetical protein
MTPREIAKLCKWQWDLTDPKQQERREMFNLTFKDFSTAMGAAQVMDQHEKLISALTALREAALIMSDPEHCLHPDQIPWAKLAQQAKEALAQ